jgi:hypothetical protein
MISIEPGHYMEMLNPSQAGTDINVAQFPRQVENDWILT